MNKEICCFTNWGKTAEDEWENDNLDFLWALYSVYQKLEQFSFHTYLLINLKKDASVKSFEQVNKLSRKTLVLALLKILHMYTHSL